MLFENRVTMFVNFTKYILFSPQWIPINLLWLAYYDYVLGINIKIYNFLKK